MSRTGSVRAAARRSWLSNLLVRTAALVLVASAVPVVSLVWVSGVARAEVEHRALDGLVATAKATVLQEQQAWDDAVRVVMSAASRPVPLSALQSRDAALASQGAKNILVTGPFAAVRIYDGAGTLVATAALPDVTPIPYGGIDTPTLTVGNPVGVGRRTARQVTVAVGAGPAGPVGRLVVDIDLTQLLGKPSDLAFGRTGVKFLVTPAGLVVAGSAAVGTPLRSDLNRAIAAAGTATTKVVYSPFYARRMVESYEPVPGQSIGIFVQQARSEVMAGADNLAARLRWAAIAVGLLGGTLAVALGVLLSRRGRRLAAGEAQARRRLEQFLDAIPIGVFVASPDGRPQYSNREAERLLGPGIVPGARDNELADVNSAFVAGTSELYPAEKEPRLRALGGETTHVDDMEIGGPDARVPVEVWGTAVFGADRSVEFGVTAIVDVSERRRAAEQVQFLSAITASMSEGVVLVRAADSAITYANGSYETMFGYGPGELVGRSVRDMTAPDPEGSRVFVGIRNALKANGTWRGDVHGLRKDGTSLWCAVNVTALVHPTLGPAWIAVNTDITARREAEEGQARLASIVRASQEAILGKTPDGIVTSWNHGAEVLFGYSAAEIIGGPIELLVPLQGREDEAQVRARVAGGLGVEHYETVRVRKDGTSVDVSATLSPIEDAGGRIVGIATICRDVTDRKRAEAALVEREEQLAAARDQALEASRLKSQFLANMSHEIRTPMNGVLGMAQLLLTGNLDPEQRRRMTQLHESGQCLLTIINDILDVSKMEAGKLELEVADFDLVATVQSVVSLCSSPAADKGLTLTLTEAPGVPEWVRGDPWRLRQILLNLVGNAVKFTERGGVDLRISQAAPSRLRFTVHDTGIGLDPSDKAHLMEPFSQADASTTRRFGGTGLGLAICRQLVELMGGSLDFTSEPGVGTTFWFELDLPVAEPGHAPVAGDRLTPVEPRKRATSGPIGNLRLLLVDDAEINRAVGKGLLESVGYEVDTVTSGVEAVDAVQQCVYAAVLMDCLMPVMDGYDATRHIRRLEGPVRHVPIIALTAAAMSGDRERCLAAGMDDYVSKPLDLDRLTAALARCRTQRTARDAPTDDKEVSLIDRLKYIRSILPEESFDRICQEFLSTVPRMIDHLGDAISTDDADAVQSVAHSLRGTTATLGAARLSALAQRVEEGKAGSATIVRQIQDEYHRARAVLVSLMEAGVA